MYHILCCFLFVSNDVFSLPQVALRVEGAGEEGAGEGDHVVEADLQGPRLATVLVVTVQSGQLGTVTQGKLGPVNLAKLFRVSWKFRLRPLYHNMAKACLPRSKGWKKPGYLGKLPSSLIIMINIWLSCVYLVNLMITSPF